MHDDLGRPGAMFVDMRPVGYPLLYVTDHEVAEQISKSSKTFNWAVHKSPTIDDIIPVIGEHSIIRKNGDDWKRLRRRFNPGFAPQHLYSLLPLVVKKTETFVQQLDKLVESGKEFELGQKIINLTFDIMCAVVLNEDLNAQQEDLSRRGELIKLFSECLSTYNESIVTLPWWLAPRLSRKRRSLAMQIDTVIAGMVQDRFDCGSDPMQSRSIVSLSLQDIEELTPLILSETVDQVKSFLFAGHDTTSILIEWAIYELSRHPKILSKAREELDSAFGPDSNPATMFELLSSERGPEIIAHLPYISAIIKEILRHHPPAGSARMSPSGSNFSLRLPRTGKEFIADGIVLYLAHSGIHHDDTVYGDTTNDFVPERWLGNSATDTEDVTEGAALPASAWRPFERGPRNCIGQQLANMEARVILATVLRKYDFVKAGLGQLVIGADGAPVLNEKGQYEVESECYTVSL